MPGRITVRVTTPVIEYMLSLTENANFIICTVVKLSNSSIITQSCFRVPGFRGSSSVLFAYLL